MKYNLLTYSPNKAWGFDAKRIKPTQEKNHEQKNRTHLDTLTALTAVEKQETQLEIAPLLVAIRIYAYRVIATNPTLATSR